MWRSTVTKVDNGKFCTVKPHQLPNSTEWRSVHVVPAKRPQRHTEGIPYNALSILKSETFFFFLGKTFVWSADNIPLHLVPWSLLSLTLQRSLCSPCHMSPLYLWWSNPRVGDTSRLHMKVVRVDGLNSYWSDLKNSWCDPFDKIYFEEKMELCNGSGGRGLIGLRP